MASSQTAPFHEVTDDNFETLVLQSSTPFLLDLTADWCMPCKTLAPTLHELSKDYAGKILFGALNIDKNRKVPGQYKIMSIPTLLLFRSGKVVGQLTGLHSKTKIIDLLSKVL